MKNFSYLTVDIWCLLPKVGELRTKPLLYLKLWSVSTGLKYRDFWGHVLHWLKKLNKRRRVNFFLAWFDKFRHKYSSL